MSPETLMFLGMIAFVICFFGVILIILIIAGGYIFSRVVKIQTEAGRALSEDTRAFFDRSAPGLYPISAGAFEDISSQMQVNGRAVLGNIHYRGQLESLSQPGRAYVAFDLQLKFGKGTMQLHTAEHRLQLNFGGIGVSQAQASADHIPFGVLADEKKGIQLRDLQGRSVGCYHRNPLEVAGLEVEPARFNFKSYYGAVDIGERTIAELNRNPLILRPRPGVEIGPLLRKVAIDLDKEETIWLLLLVGWEIYIKIINR